MNTKIEKQESKCVCFTQVKIFHQIFFQRKEITAQHWNRRLIYWHEASLWLKETIIWHQIRPTLTRDTSESERETQKDAPPSPQNELKGAHFSPTLATLLPLPSAASGKGGQEYTTGRDKNCLCEMEAEDTSNPIKVLTPLFERSWDSFHLVTPRKKLQQKRTALQPVNSETPECNFTPLKFLQSSNQSLQKSTASDILVSGALWTQYPELWHPVYLFWIHIYVTMYTHIYICFFPLLFLYHAT